MSLKAFESVALTMLTVDLASVGSEGAAVSVASVVSEVSVIPVSDVSGTVVSSEAVVSSVSEVFVSVVVSEVSGTVVSSDVFVSSEDSVTVSSITVSEGFVSDISSAITETVGNIPCSTSKAERTPAEILLAIFFCIWFFPPCWIFVCVFDF